MRRKRLQRVLPRREESLLWPLNSESGPPHLGIDQLRRDLCLSDLGLPGAGSWAGLRGPIQEVQGWAEKRQERQPEIEDELLWPTPTPTHDCSTLPHHRSSLPRLAPLHHKVIGGRCPSQQVTDPLLLREDGDPKGDTPEGHTRGCHGNMSRLPALQGVHPGEGSHSGTLPGGPEFHRKARGIAWAESVGKGGPGDLPALSHWGPTGLRAFLCRLPGPNAGSIQERASVLVPFALGHAVSSNNKPAFLKCIIAGK